jgi:hypothetical protein
MDSELKKILELERQVQQLKSALETERLKAEILNNIIEKANLEQGAGIDKINIPHKADFSDRDDKKPT